MQQDVEHVRVGLLNLVEQDDPVGPPADGLGQLSGVIVAHIARRRADEPGNGVPLAILGHIQPHHAVLVVEEEFGQGPAQLRLAHAGGSQEYKAAERPLGVIEAGTGAADGVGDGVDGFFLADDPPVQVFFHVQQPFGLAFHQLPDGDARPV